MTQPIPGIHHVTAIAGEPQRNLDFYTGLLGLRLVKTTVNFDDPGTYHLYFADELGDPGTVLTFFPSPHARRGVAGSGEASAVAFAIEPGALAYWCQRLAEHRVAFHEESRFGERVLAFRDPDGLSLELVATAEASASQRWAGGSVPREHALAGFHGVTLTATTSGPTAEVLHEVMGFRRTVREGSRQRFELPAGDRAHHLDLVVRDAPPARIAAGSVHHVAWRIADDQAQSEWREALMGAGLFVTPVRDRRYFHSIYFREPGGVLFELATDGPGFTLDESAEALGTELALPPWLEPHRERIAKALPALDTRRGAASPGVA